MIFQILLKERAQAPSLSTRRSPLRRHQIEKRCIIIDIIKDLPNEEWREVKGYGGKYLVSNMGRIKSLKHRKPKLLTAFVNNKGYARVALCNDG